MVEFERKYIDRRVTQSLFGKWVAKFVHLWFSYPVLVENSIQTSVPKKNLSSNYQPDIIMIILKEII